MIVFGNTKAFNIQNLQYNVNNSVLNIVDSIKYLCGNVTNDFHSSDHNIQNQSKAVQMLGMPKRNLSLVPQKNKTNHL